MYARTVLQSRTGMEHINTENKPTNTSFLDYVRVGPFIDEHQSACLGVEILLGLVHYCLSELCV